MHVHPPSPPCASLPPPQPERLVMRKDEAVGNQTKMHVCLPKHIYKLDDNLLTVVLDPEPYPDPDPDPHVFGPPGSFYHAKIVRKTLIPSILYSF
jgi:hypothetical protein